MYACDCLYVKGIENNLIFDSFIANVSLGCLDKRLRDFFCGFLCCFLLVGYKSFTPSALC